MNQKLTRRQFGQIAIAGTTVAALSHLAGKNLAQAQQTPAIIGLRLGPPSTNPIASRTVLGRNDSGVSIPDVEPPARSLSLQSLNVANRQARALPSPKILLQSGEGLTGLTSLADGTIVIAITPNSPSREERDASTRLIFLGKPPRTLIVSGLNKKEALGSLTGTNDGRLLGLVVNKNGAPPVRQVSIDIRTGRISFDTEINLPGKGRYANLAQCPDGKLYSTVVKKKGDTFLVQVDPKQKKLITLSQLKINNKIWNNGLQSLVCGPKGQFYAFGGLRYQFPTALYLLDPKTGAMTQRTPFNSAKITIPRG